MATITPGRTTTMKAIVQDRYGPADVLEARDMERPTPADNEVLIKVRAASVGAWDWHDIRGEPFIMRLLARSLRAPRKSTPGLDVAGEVVATGPAASRYRIGDAVYGECERTFAEYTATTEDRIALKPTTLDFTEAAAVPVAGSTALMGLRDEANLQPGESVLIVGAASGVGTFAVQIAKAMGADVTGVCSTSSAELVRSLGADHIIDYTKDDFTELGRPYDVIFQIAGSASARACLRALKPKGRLVLCSGDGGGRFFGPLGRIAGGLLLSPFVSQTITTYVAKAGTQNLEELATMIDEGQVKPVIDSTYPLADAAAALERFGHGHGPGKIVLAV